MAHPAALAARSTPAVPAEAAGHLDARLRGHDEPHSSVDPA
jgi:hypothetical protein